MIQSLSIDELCDYTSAQLNYFFPDNTPVALHFEKLLVKESLERLDHCFKHVTLKHYFNGKQTVFNHLYSDHYVMFLWYLSNTVYKHKGKCDLANKIYYLNKALHGLDCMFDTRMPDIFLVFHSSGTMLGKAEYSDFFIALQGCTVGSQKGNYPVFGKAVALTANSSVIGKCTIGDRCTISTRTTIFQKNLANDCTAFVNFEDGRLQVKPSKECYAQHFFNVDLKTI